MIRLTSMAGGVLALALTSGAAFAQSNTGGSGPMGAMGGMNSGAMSSGTMHMSKTSMRTMKVCMAMTHDNMMKNMKCKRFMAKHSEMMNSDGTMKNGMMPKK